MITDVHSTRFARHALLSSLVLIAVAGDTVAQTKIKPELDIIYAKAGGRELKLDLARPVEGKGPFPVVVCIHGGGWRLGNKRDMREWITLLAGQGYVAASVGYRLVPDATFPSQIEDCKTAVRYLRANSQKYNMDGNRVGVLGYSAGGHLACLLGLTDEKAGFEGTEHSKESSKVQAVVDYFGPTDLSGFAKDDTAQRGMLGPFIGSKFADNPSAHEKASPIKYVNKHAPPFLIFHGDKDRIVPLEQSRLLKERLKDVGVDVELIEVPNEGHGWNDHRGIASTKKTLDFLAEKLKK